MTKSSIQRQAVPFQWESRKASTAADGHVNSMNQRMEQAKHIHVVAQALTHTTEAFADIFDLVKILASQMPHVDRIDFANLAISGIGQTLVVFTHEFFRIKQEAAAIARRDAALGPGIQVERFVNKHAAFAGFD